MQICQGRAQYTSRVNEFSSDVVAAVLAHMNEDHTDDNTQIAQAFGYPDVISSTMTNITTRSGTWRVTDASGVATLEIPWFGGEISERAEIRREVVAIYQEATRRLGIESEPGVGTTQEDQSREVPEHVPFSTEIRERSWGDHSDSEGADFMANIMRGTGTLDDYRALAAQHYFLYVELERAAQLLTADAELAEFHPPALARVAALEADLEALFGPDWHTQIAPVPATEEYASRIRRIAEDAWLPGIVAHHYTRYLGDLSGGQMIARRVAKQHQLDGGGVEFYDFAALGPIEEFKVAYRALLDGLGARMSDEERERFLEEVGRAYAFNTAVFVDLAEAKALASKSAG